MILEAAPQLLVNGLVLGSLYALVAVSWGLIYSTTSVLHFAHALTISVAGYAAVTVAALGIPLAGVFLLAGVAAALIGQATDWSVYRPLRRRNANEMNVLLASFGVLLAGEAVLSLTFGPTARQLAGGVYSTVLVGRVSINGIDMITVAASWLVIGVLGAILTWTRRGTAIRAVESNADLALAMGVDKDQVFRNVFYIGSFAVGVAAALVVLRTTASPGMGVDPLIAGVVGVFIGGIGSKLGAAMGGLLLGLAQSLGGVVLPGYLQPTVGFVILFLVILLKPSGLFAGAELRES